MRKYFTLKESIPWFEKGTILEQREECRDGGWYWALYGSYCHEDIPQREVISWYFNRSELRKKFFAQVYIVHAQSIEEAIRELVKTEDTKENK